MKVSGSDESCCGNLRFNLLVLVKWEEIQQQPTNRPPAPLVAVEIQVCSIWDVLRREALVLLQEAPRSSGLSFYCIFFFNLSDVFDAKAFISFYHRLQDAALWHHRPAGPGSASDAVSTRM